MRLFDVNKVELGLQTPITTSSRKWGHMRPDPSWIWHEWRVADLEHQETAANQQPLTLSWVK